MKSDFLNTAIKPTPQGLSGSFTGSWLIDDYYNKLRIVGRNPTKGKPAPGNLFSLTVEIKTDPGEHFYDLYCPDLFVVVRDVNSNRVWASKYISTHVLDGCGAESTLIFARGFVPDNAHWVKIELYDDASTTLAEAQTADPLAVSPAINFAQDLTEGRSSGVYENADDNGFFNFGNNSDGTFFDNINSTFNKFLILGGIGAGAYFLSPFFPEIKAGFTGLADKFKGKENSNA